MNLMAEIQNVIAQAKEIPELEALSAKLESTINKLSETAIHIGTTAMSPESRCIQGCGFWLRKTQHPFR
jgi:hypothetical protein